MAQPSIAIIGAGLAGMTAALRLIQKGIKTTIFEANPSRIGGRVWSDKFIGLDGISQKYERGGELIDGRHIETKQLAKELDLTLVNIYKTPKDTTTLYQVTNTAGESVKYSTAQAEIDFKLIWKYISDDAKACPFPTTYDNYTDRALVLSNKPLGAYIDQLTQLAGLSNTYLAQVLKVAFTIEFGIDIEKQSSLNLVYLTGYAGPGQLRLFGQLAEKFTIVEGNDQLVIRAHDNAVSLGNSPVRLGHKVTSLTRRSDGKYNVTVWSESFNLTFIYVYDRVIMAVPIWVMKPDPKYSWHLDVSGAQFSQKKMEAINNMGVAESTKLMIQFDNKFWNDAGNDGSTYATKIVSGKETLFQSSWESTIGQPGSNGIITNFLRGTYSEENGKTTGVDSESSIIVEAEKFINQFGQLVNGTPAVAYESSHDANGIFTSNHYSKNWARDEYIRGAYAGYTNGAEVSYVGIEDKAEPMSIANVSKRNCHFCGEYTSLNFIGYMNGAIESGNRVAGEILAILKK